MRVSVEAESDYSGSPCSMNFDEELEQVPEEVEADVEEALSARRPSPPPKRGAPQEPEAEVECPICVSLFCEPVSPRTSLAYAMLWGHKWRQATF